MTEPQIEQLATLPTWKPWGMVILTAAGGVVAGAALGSGFGGMFGNLLSLLFAVAFFSLWQDWRILPTLIGGAAGAFAACWLAMYGLEGMDLANRTSDVVSICVLVVGAVGGGSAVLLVQRKLTQGMRRVAGFLACGVFLAVIGGMVGRSVGGGIGGGLVATFCGVMLGRSAVRSHYKKECIRTVARYSEQLRLDPQSAETYLNRGNANLLLEEYDQAIADFTEAIRLKPDFAAAYCNRGSAHGQQDRIDEALADYAESIRIDPELVSAYYSRGCLHHQRSEHEKAVADYTETLRIDSQNSAAHQMLAASHKAMSEEITCDQNQNIQGAKERRPDGFFSDIRTRALVAASAVGILLVWGAWGIYNEKASKASYRQGLEALHKYDYPSAIRHFSKAIQHDPEFVDAYYHRGIAHDCSHNYDAAVADFTEMIKLEPRNGVAYDLRALAHRGKRNYGLAEADYCEAIRLGCMSHQNLGDLYMDMKKYRQAVANYTRAIKHRPDDGTGYTKRAAAYRALGDEEHTAVDSRKGKELNRSLVDEIMKSNH